MNAKKYTVAEGQRFVGKTADGSEQMFEADGKTYLETDFDELTFLSAYAYDWLVEVEDKKSK